VSGQYTRVYGIIATGIENPPDHEHGGQISAHHAPLITHKKTRLAVHGAGW